MKPHPRICKTITWGGATVALLLFLAWAGTIRWYCYYMTAAGSGVALSDGQLTLSNHAWSPMPAFPAGWVAARSRSVFRWWFDWYWSPPRAYFSVPLLLLAALSLILSRAARLLDKLARHRAGCCLKCGYDRAGLGAGTKCPECGAVSSGPEGR